MIFSCFAVPLLTLKQLFLFYHHPHNSNNMNSTSTSFFKSKRAPSFDSKSEGFKFLYQQWTKNLTNPSKGISVDQIDKPFVQSLYDKYKIFHQYNKTNFYTNYIRHKNNFDLEQQQHGARKQKKVRSK